MITFQLEEWEPFYKDAQHIFPIHWRDLALDQEAIPMSLDCAKFEEIEKRGQLHILTIRKGEKLIGYYIAILVVHPHYKDSGLMSTTDMFYVLREYRRGGIGAKLIIKAEETLRARGVKKAFIGTKIHQDHSELFTALGWTPTDKVYTKCLS